MPEIDIYENLKPTLERDAMNAFPFWFDKIKNCGIRVPKSITVPVPEDVQKAFYHERPRDMARIQEFADECVYPAIQEAGLGLVFLKNAMSSNKFDAGRSCLPVMSDLGAAISNIMYNAISQSGPCQPGIGLLVIRERIPYDAKLTPCIYNGLPFRTEYRVFYDFDRKRPIFITDYWRADYVYPRLYDYTDRLVYGAHYPAVRSRYELHKDKVLDLVSQSMQGVQGLPGPWSIDILENESGEFWLIDMAVAEQSAYWEKRGHAASMPMEPMPSGQLRTEAYRLYQLDWMASHGHSPASLVDSVLDLFDDTAEAGCHANLFLEWEADAGFDGECWACYNEFLECEYLDVEYMRRILPGRLLPQYLGDAMIKAKRQADGLII